ncbi:heme-degrading domain-containing protein [Cellulomonas sp. ATA003]|uniref:heme-degrading domain-containing protein n=1 Tax=Cellulomonas sp. ATA003 TaxID=3073064 RepID=UPI0028730090|nr:heme-degrading domain-containing protein [Cellulomonas sp. ATA003]WNB84282.1 heme-degrading domain-containing protein [Cellulomonas sp. ATA003]
MDTPSTAPASPTAVSPTAASSPAASSSASDEPDVAALVARVEAEERELVFTRFDNDDAWRLGSRLVATARERGLGVTVDIRRGPQQLFHAALPGTTADNDTWIVRKVRVVERFGASSYLVGLRARLAGTTFAAQHELPLQEYAAHGGCFPVRVRDVGVVGTVTVSGLPRPTTTRSSWRWSGSSSPERRSHAGSRGPAAGGRAHAPRAGHRGWHRPD